MHKNIFSWGPCSVAPYLVIQLGKERHGVNEHPKVVRRYRNQNSFNCSLEFHISSYSYCAWSAGFIPGALAGQSIIPKSAKYYWNHPSATLRHDTMSCWKSPTPGKNIDNIDGYRWIYVIFLHNVPQLCQKANVVSLTKKRDSYCNKKH